jgi:tRNA(Ile)-lysidine synthase
MIDLQIRAAMLDVLGDLASGSAMVVGVSGGADSIALLRAAVHVAAEREWHVHAVIVDHALQNDSAVVAQHAATIARGLGPTSVKVVAVEVATGPGHGGVEAAARTARRAALQVAAAELSASAILLGHTRDDQAESVLLGLARGSGARSLSGMREHDGIWRRPLLRVPRELVRASVAEIDTFEDPHNSDARFLRPRVRHEVLPVMSDVIGDSVVESLARTADMLRDDADALDSLAQQYITQEVAELALLPRAVRTRILRDLAREAGCPPNDLTREHVLAVDALITSWHGQGPLNLPGGVTCARRNGRLSFERK